MSKRLTCNSCGHQWESSSSKPRVSCICGQKVKNDGPEVHIKAHTREGGSVRVKSHERGRPEERVLAIDEAIPGITSGRGEKPLPTLEELKEKARQKILQKQLEQEAEEEVLREMEQERQDNAWRQEAESILARRDYSTSRPAGPRKAGILPEYTQSIYKIMGLPDMNKGYARLQSLVQNSSRPAVEQKPLKGCPRCGNVYTADLYTCLRCKAKLERIII